MDAPSFEQLRRARRDRCARLALVLLAAVLVLGVWEGFGVLLYGIEGSYEH